MIDNVKVINFLQDFGCAKLGHLQILFNDSTNNFKNILKSNIVSKKDDIFVHNTRSINNRMLIALDILCKFKKQNKLSQFYMAYEPISITFISKENLKYHIIVADENNKKGIIKRINSYPLSIPKADKLILAFPDREGIENISCIVPFLYCIYPDFEIIN